MSYPLLLSPGRIGSLTLRNRTVMAAMSSGLADDRGRVTPKQIAYYAERARGGVGMVTVEFACVDSSYGVSEPHQVVLDDPEAVAGHAALVAAVHDLDTPVALQLQLPGQYADPSWNDGRLPSAPSEVRGRRDGALRAREFDAGEIVQLVEKFRRAAAMAMTAGYDALELHGAHGYLLMAFLSPATNRRTDEWGGDGERRLALPLAVIRALKGELGDKPLLYRISADDFTDGGLSIDDMVDIAPRLAAAGVDALNVSTGTIGGTLETTIDPMSEPEGWRFELTRRIRESVDIPVIGIGVRWPQTAEDALASGAADLIALGRPLLADPSWVAKAAGKGGEIRPCTSCNWCADRVFKHLPVGCAENPRTADEQSPIAKADAGGGRRVVVLGGGPGGMAAAIQADSVGFDTVLFERRDTWGGGLIASAAPPRKGNLLWYRDYLLRRLEQSTVDHRLLSAPTVQQIVDLQPYAVLLAGGASASAPHIEGIGDPAVRFAYDLLMEKPEPDALGDGPAVVYGGGETGCETAEYLADLGIATTLVTRSEGTQLARAAEPLYRKVLLRRLRANPLITILENTAVMKVGGGEVVLEEDGFRRSLPADLVVMAQGRTVDTALLDELTALGLRTVSIGDGRLIGRIGDAVHDAHRAVATLLPSQGVPLPA